MSDGYGSLVLFCAVDDRRTAAVDLCGQRIARHTVFNRFRFSVINNEDIAGCRVGFAGAAVVLRSLRLRRLTRGARVRRHEAAAGRSCSETAFGNR